jgi:peptide/nickel transport system permease protein
MATAATTTAAQDQLLVKPRRARHPIATFIAKRVAAGVVTLLVVSFFIFFATQALPGNVAQIVLGKNATPQAIAGAEHRLGLDRPFLQRYGDWLGGMVTGDLGDSAVAVAQGAPSAPISKEVGEPFRNSAILAGLVIFLMIPLSVILGTIAASRAGRPVDHVTSMTSLVIGAFPEFVFGTLLIFVFFSQLNWFQPVALIPPGQSPLAHLDLMVLPVLTALGVVLAAGVRQIRAGMIETLDQDYVAMATINGLPRRRVQWRYALRNALPAGVQITAQNIQYLLGGIIIVESVFTYPGIGTYLVNAVNVRDVGAVEAVAMILATVYIVINILADLIVVLLVPKLRTGL